MQLRNLTSNDVAEYPLLGNEVEFNEPLSVISNENDEMQIKPAASNPKKPLKASLIIPEEVPPLQLSHNPTFMGKDVPHRLITGKLFESEPELFDLHYIQADFFALSTALHAILVTKEGSQSIANMMREFEQDKVCVRLFDKETHVPVYILMTKSVPVDPEILKVKSPWIQLLLKAYAILQGGYDRLLEVTNQPNYKSVEEKLYTFTGAQHSGYCELPLQYRKRLVDIKEPILSPGSGIYAFNELMRVTNETHPKLKAFLCKEIFNDNEVCFNQWIRFITENTESWQSTLQFARQITLSHFLNIIRAQLDKPGNEAIRAAHDWVIKAKIFSGRAGEYSAEELTLFNDFKYHLDRSQPIVLMNYFVHDKNEKRKSSLYSSVVVGVEESEQGKEILLASAGTEVKMKPQLFFKTNKDSEIVTGWGVRRMELSLFCREFKHLFSFESVAPSAIDQKVDNYINQAKLKYGR